MGMSIADLFTGVFAVAPANAKAGTNGKPTGEAPTGERAGS